MAKNPAVEEHARRIRRRVDRIDQQVNFLNGSAPIAGRLGVGIATNPARQAKVEKEKTKQFRLFLQQLEIIYGVKLTQLNVNQVVNQKKPKRPPKKKG